MHPIPRLLLALAWLLAACAAPPEPLLLLSTSPIDGSQLPDLQAAFELTFDRPLDPRSVVPGAVALRVAGAEHPCELSLLPGGTRLRARPSAPLPASSTVRLSVGPPLRGQRGEEPGGAFSAEFRTGTPQPQATMRGSGRTLTGGRLTAIPRAADDAEALAKQASEASKAAEAAEGAR